MKDPIEREDAIRIIDETVFLRRPILKHYIKAKIERIPSAEKQGEWIISEVKFGIYKYQCKDCGWHEYHAYGDVKPHNFCPNCGADCRG